MCLKLCIQWLLTAFKFDTFSWKVIKCAIEESTLDSTWSETVMIMREANVFIKPDQREKEMDNSQIV